VPKNNVLQGISDNIFEHNRRKNKSINEINSMKLSLSFIKALDVQMRELNYELIPKNKVDYLLDYIEGLLHHLNCRMFKLNESTWNAFLKEQKRIHQIINYYKMMEHVNFTNALKSKDKNIIDLEKSIFKAAFTIESYTDSHDLILVVLLEKFQKALKSVLRPLTKKEFDEIHKAMEVNFHSGYKQGHWYECPNGHPYCITECGGAMEEAKCLECNCAIGGQNHALLGNNRVSNLAGARYAAYSDAANMANYDIEDIE
jgi:hypothetical protein